MPSKNMSLPNAGNCKMEILPTVDVREVWKDEARNFTPWLANKECLSLLADVLGIEGVEIKGDPRTETNVAYSSRRCDIEAQVKGDGDDEAKTIIIENQLEETDFSHLGRIMLYAAQREAKYVVWVVPEVSQDHRKVIAWLNKNTTANVDFYLVKIDLFKLGDAHMMPLFSLVEGPDNEEKVKSSGSPRQRKNFDFWSGFYDFVTDGVNRGAVSCVKSFRQPGRDNWYDISIGTSTCHFALWNSNQQADVSIYTDGKETFAKLLSSKDKIIEAAGVPPEQVIVNDGNTHPVMRFPGPQYGDDREVVYRWFAERIAALVPIVREALGVRA